MTRSEAIEILNTYDLSKDNTDEEFKDAIRTALEALKEPEWMDAENPPDTDRYILLNFANYSIPAIGRYEGNEEEGGNYYVGDDDEPISEIGVIVSAWKELPKSYENNNIGAQ